MHRTVRLLSAALSIGPLFALQPATLRLQASAPSAARTGELPPERSDAVDEFVRAKMAQKQIPGLSIAVLRDGKVLKEKAYGFANLELRVPATAETSFPLASMTKIFTAAAIMQLVEQGKVTLDQPVIALLPQLPATWSKVTLRHCLSHTTGLPSATLDDVNVTALAGDREGLLRKLAPLPVDPPGESISYNTTDYVLLAMVLEKVSGLGFEQVIQQHLLKPAGMSTASFGDAWAIIPNRADLYTNLEITPDHGTLRIEDGHPVVMKDRILHYGHKVWPDYIAAAGGLNGTVRDLVKWELALSTGKILQPSSLAEMARPYTLANGKEGFFGLGFVTVPLAGAGSVSYGGGAATWRVEIPKEHLTIILLTNLQGAQPENFIAEIAALYLSKPASN